MKLTLNLIPSTMWYSNLRSLLTSKSWKDLSQDCFTANNYKCELCGNTGIYNNGKIIVECHEEWSFDPITKTQKLEKLLSLCTMCHRVKHSGLWYLKGQKEMIIKHFCYVNKCSRPEAISYISNEFRIHNERSNFEWNLELSLILSNPKTKFKKIK